jgi:lipopolysaccharide/colanic/teichoic acid biosynthesis glycosyltransferase
MRAAKNRSYLCITPVARILRISRPDEIPLAMERVAESDMSFVGPRCQREAAL